MAPKAQDKDDSVLSRRLLEFSRQLEGSRIADYVHLLNTPGRLIYLNFVAGLARGLGIALGATILAALVLYVLQRSFVANLPIIGGFIAEIVRIVMEQLNTTR